MACVCGLGWLLLCANVIGLHALATPPKLSTPSSSSSPSFLHIDAELLTGLLSSSERYAQALNMTVEDVERTKNLHNYASQELHRKLQSNDLSGTEKHSLICQNRLDHGRHPFCCPNCWSYTPVCICSLVKTKRPLPIEKVLVWTHHREWGLTSNTGCLLPLTLQNTQILMKGYPKHDRILQQSLSQQDCLAVVLWPDTAKPPTKDDDDDNGKTNGSPSSTSTDKVATISLEEVKAEMKHKRLILIAVDGTWRNARRMVSKLPRSVPRLDLPLDVVFDDSDNDNSNKKTSILAPLRSKGPAGRVSDDVFERQVCTAEAVASALMQLGLPVEDGQHLLRMTQTKVDLIRRYRGIRL